MIYRWDSTHAVAVAADGKVSIGSCNDGSVSWSGEIRELCDRRTDDTESMLPDSKRSSLQCPNEITAQKVCVRLSMLAILTSDNRILICFNPQDQFEDITPDVCRILQGTTDIRYIAVCYTQTIMIMTSNRIAIIEVDDKHGWIGKYRIKGRILYETQYEIDMHSADWTAGSGTIRTTDNCLHRINHRSSYSSKESSLDCWRIEQLEFHDISSISEIVGDCYYVFLIMYDGTVYARNFLGIWGPEYLGPFKQVVFPEHEAIIEIVLAFCDIFFITDAGNCYYAKDFLRSKGAIEGQIRSLSGYLVEDICETGNGWAIRHSGCVCILHTVLPQIGPILKLYPHDKKVFEQYVSGTKKPRELSFFNDKAIVSIKTLFDGIYFITDEGHVFWTNDFDETMDPVITRDTYFDANPLAVKKNTCSIRSARSLLNDA